MRYSLEVMKATHIDVGDLLALPPSRMISQVSEQDNWLSEEEAVGTRQFFYKNPFELVRLLPQFPFQTELVYPGIYAGVYAQAAFEAPAEGVRSLLQFFGARDSDDLLDRTKGIVEGVFSETPEGSELVSSALDLVGHLRFGKQRKTGEKAVTHESRVLLRGLSEEFQNRNNLSQASVGNDLFQVREFDDLFKSRNNLTLATICTAWALHDFFEDFVLREKGALLNGEKLNRDVSFWQEENKLKVVKKGDKQPMTISFPNKGHTDFGLDLLIAFTNPNLEHMRISDIEETALNIDLMLEHVEKSSHISARAISEGKTSDREDNVSTLWFMEKERYLAKLVETAKHFGIISTQAWSFPKRKLKMQKVSEDGRYYAPLASTTAFLQLLGASSDELFAWITQDQEMQNRFAELEGAGKGPLVVPNPHKATLWWAGEGDGISAEIFYRNK